MKRKPPDDKHDSADRWLLTYADMITLLMAFFIMMYSMSVLNLSKFRDAAISIRSGFGGVQKGQGTSVMGAGVTGTSVSSLSQLIQHGSTWDAVNPLVEFTDTFRKSNKDALKVSEDSRGIVITIKSDHLLFTPGDANIDSHAYPVLDKVAETLVKLSNPIQIDGHTCNLPIHSAKYSSNWALSSARAESIMRYFTESKGLDQRQFGISGYADTRPAAINDTEENRQKNRRVEIIIQRKPRELAPNLLPTSSQPDESATTSYIQRRRE